MQGLRGCRSPSALRASFANCPSPSRYPCPPAPVNFSPASSSVNMFSQRPVLFVDCSVKVASWIHQSTPKHAHLSQTKSTPAQ